MNEVKSVTLTRHRYVVTLADIPKTQRASFVASVFHAVPQDAILEHVQQLSNGSIEVWFVEEREVL